MNKQRILIIDDEQVNLEFFEVMLSRLGFEIFLAADGEEGLEKILEFKPDLILLDNIMPKMTGWEVTRLIKKDEKYSECKDIPIIMFSAMDAVSDKIEGFELGIEDYITKPYNFSEVLARVRAVLRAREMTKRYLHSEKEISLRTSLQDSLVYFTSHLKQPVDDLLSSASTLDCTDSSAVEKFVEQVKAECSQTLATLKGLEDEIEDLKGRDGSFDDHSKVLVELDEKFKSHLKEMKSTQEVR